MWEGLGIGVGICGGMLAVLVATCVLGAILAWRNRGEGEEDESDALEDRLMYCVDTKQP